MRLLKRVLIIALLSCLFISCKDDETNPVETGKSSANIASADYEIVTAHKSYYEPGSPWDSYDYLYGLKLTLTLEDPAQRGNINKVSLSSDTLYYEFTKQELDGAYADSIGGYIFDFISITEGSNPPSLIWNVKLYSSSGDTSNAYKLAVNFYNRIFTHYCASDWTGESTLEISLSNLNTDLGQNAVAETHFLNQDSIETGVSTSAVKNNKWTACNAPADAVSFYYIISSQYQGLKRKFISKAYPLDERLPENTRWAGGIVSPFSIKYIKDIDKMLAISSDKLELRLLNPKTDDLVWTKKLNSEFEAFAYSSERGAIYVEYMNGVVDSIDPADGSGRSLFNCYSTPGHIFLSNDSLIIIPGYYANSYKIYDLNTKQLYQRGAGFGYISIYRSAYNPKNRRIYFLVSEGLNSYRFNASTGEFADYKLYGINQVSGDLHVMFFNYAMQKIFLGTGDVYAIPANINGDLIREKFINPFCDLTYISDMQIATVAPEYWQNDQKQPAAISIYDLSNYNLLGYKTGLIGTPKKIYADGDYLKVYYTDNNGKLMVRKYAVQDILNSSSGKINGNRKKYTMKKL